MQREQITYTKLSDLVNDEFTIEKAGGYNFKKWDEGTRRMLISESYQEGYRKVYTIDTDKGRLDIGSGQLSALLEAVYTKGTADINGRTFKVKSNGKSGMDIRYYFNPVREAAKSSEGDGYDKFQQVKSLLYDKQEKDTVLEDISEEPIDLSQIPF